MTDLVRVTFECEECGGTVLSVEDDHTDASVVFCKACGRSHGSFGDLKKEAVGKALRFLLVHARQSVKK
ncbi:MAG: hypothetical protein ACE368_13600 [Paracoccaceae bacterium]